MTGILKYISIVFVCTVLDALRPRYCFADIISINSHTILEEFGNFYVLLGLFLVLINIAIAYIKFKKVKSTNSAFIGLDDESKNEHPLESGHSNEK
ncbi:MAG TPA: hypothetical protein PKW98_14370 [Candidatus Wallbacteria bacterium]|nr:MAG: hypothetical protein BWY32_02793 [bacterium ADurb.Bin243]HPG59001.1 hypothetical protein [Candidatus Wallbacteria bacterium]